jgi:hypothetical protein
MHNTRHRISRAVILATVLAAGQAVASDIVRLKYAQFDPLAALPAVSPALASIEGAGVYLVQFRGSPTEPSRALVRAAGGTIGPFLTDHTHLVRMDQAAAARVSALPSIRWVGPYRAAYRLSDEAAADAVGANPEDSGIRYALHLFDRGPAIQAAVAARIKNAGGIIDTTDSPGFRMEATLTPAQLRAVVAMPEVVYIERSGAPGADMTLARTVSGAIPYLSNLNFLGQGVRGQVTDDGLRASHAAFLANPPIFYGPIPPIEFHGTATYGISFSTGIGNINATGMVPAAQGIFLGYAQLTDFGGPVTRYTAVSDLVNPALSWQGVYQLSPWGGSLTTAYTSTSAEIDDIVFLYDIIVSQSQSNMGSLQSRPQAWGKNVVSVGGVDLRGTINLLDDQTDGASFGPAADGRVKPELTHSYNDATTTCETNDACYGPFGGTSASSAIVAGTYGLVHQMWHQGVWAGFGGGSTVFASRPRSATARALVISSTHQYDWNQGGPNATLTRGQQGWGLPNVQTMHAIASRTFIINGTDPVEHAQTRTYQVQVAPGEPSLRAVMVYTDPAGIPAAAHARINDLTLRVTPPPGGGAAYFGNEGLYAGIWSTPGGFADSVNTVECVFIQNPAAGVWTIEVIGSEVVQEAWPDTPAIDSSFSLVAAGATPYTPPPPCLANCDGSTIKPLLTPNDFACFLNAYAEGFSTANCDGSTLEPLLTPNDFLCFVNAYANGCAS